MSDDQQPKPRRPSLGMFAILVPNIWDHPKIVEASSEAGAEATLVYIFALTTNAETGRTGFIPAARLQPRYLARRLGIDDQRAANAVSALTRVGLLEVRAGDTDVCIPGFDDKYRRSEASDYERERKRAWRAAQSSDEISTDADSGSKKTKSKTEKDRKTQTQNQKKSVPDKSGTRPGQSLGVVSPLAYPMSEAEKERAWEIVRVLQLYTGTAFATNLELEHVVRRLRDGVPDWQLMALAAYSADDSGLGWNDKSNADGAFYMRGHLNVTKIFADQLHFTKYLSSAVSVDAWLCDMDVFEVHAKVRERMYSSSGKALPRPKQAEAKPPAEQPEWMTEERKI